MIGYSPQSINLAYVTSRFVMITSVLLEQSSSARRK